MKKIGANIFVFLVVFLLMFSCEDSNDVKKQRIEVIGAEAIKDRITILETDSIIPVETNLKSALRNKKFKLYYRGKVKSPKLKNVDLRATHISMNGNYAFISYNHEGSTYLGGVDLVDLSNPKKPVLINSVVFYDTDVSSVYFDPVSKKLYLATATENSEFGGTSVMEEVDLEGYVPTTNSRRIGVPSYVATDVKVMDDKVFVTSGNKGGLSIFNQNDLSQIKYFDIENARAVEYTSKYIIVMQGLPARLRYYDRKNLEFLGSFTYDGANIPEAKSAFTVENDKVFIGGGDKGVIITDIFSSNVLETIPIPNVPGVIQDSIQSNSVTVEDGLIFIANGEAGVHVAEYNYETNQATLLGRTKFQQKESANFVVEKNNWLFIARGKSGFHIVQVQY